MLEVIKEIAKRTIEAEELTDFTTAIVISEKPLKIQITQKLILSKNYLVIPENLIDHFTYMTGVEDNFNDIKDKGKYEARKKYIVYNGLRTGDTVILARAAGGQKYYVIDRTGVNE